MTNEKRDQEREGELPRGLSRRDFVALSLAASLAAATRSASGTELPVIEANVEVKTPDGRCDALFIHPKTGSHPGVLVWHDSLGLRPAIRDLGRRIASEGYSALVPNLFYRTARAPVFDSSFDYAKNPADREKYRRITAPFFAPGAAERDAVAYVAFLDAQRPVNKKKKIGTHGYCLGGPYVMKTAAAVADRVGAGASFHAAFWSPTSPIARTCLRPRLTHACILQSRQMTTSASPR